MAITLPEGLGDISKELNETTTNTTALRISHYNDAVIDFANERKWSQIIKENTSITTDGNANYTYDISAITDMRKPGGIKFITVGTSSVPWTPIPWADRYLATHKGKKRFCIDPDFQNIIFLSDPGSGDTLHIWYYFIPARTTDTSTPGTFAVPANYRKCIGLLAASYVQGSRYLTAQANRLYNLYQRELQKLISQDMEEPTFKPKKFGNYLQHIGWRRRYN